MRSIDFTPLYRSTVGFDRLAQMLDTVSTGESTTGYPPYNIEKTGDDAYRITVAVAGFTESELTIESRDGALIIAGRKSDEDEGTTFLHRGIAARAFERRFQLAEHVRAVSARTENGLLHVDLVRDVPEALRPRQIQITSGPVLEAKATKKVRKN